MSLQLGLGGVLAFLKITKSLLGMGKETPWCCGWCSCTSQGQSRLRSFLLSSVVPGLVAQAVFGLGLIKNQIKSDLGSTVHEEENKQTCIPPCHRHDGGKDPHRPALDTQSLAYHHPLQRGRRKTETDVMPPTDLPCSA